MVTRLFGSWGPVLVLLCALILVSFTGVSMLRGSSVATTPNPGEVVDAYEAARKTGDAEVLIKVFADDAVIVDRLGHAHSGRDELRRLLQITSSRGAALPVTDRHQNGNHVFWLEPAATPDSNIALGMEAVIERGRIISLVYRGDEAALFENPQPASHQLLTLLGLVLPLLVACVALAGVWLWTRPAAVVAPPRAALLGELTRWTQARRTKLADGAGGKFGRFP